MGKYKTSQLLSPAGWFSGFDVSSMSRFLLFHSYIGFWKLLFLQKNLWLRILSFLWHFLTFTASKPSDFRSKFYNCQACCSFLLEDIPQNFDGICQFLKRLDSKHIHKLRFCNLQKAIVTEKWILRLRQAAKCLNWQWCKQ